MSAVARGPAEHERELAESLRVTLARLNRRLRLTQVSRGLSSSDREVLIVIARARTLRLAELAKVEALNSTMLSRIIKKLEASGLVTRECDTRDARIIHLAITPAGISMRNTIQKEQSAALLLALQKLSGEERLLLTAAAPVLLDVINKLRESNQ